MPPLPIARVFLESLAEISIRWRLLVQELWVLELCILVCRLAALPLASGAVEAAASPVSNLPAQVAAVVLGALGLGLGIAVAVTTHRIVLLGHGSAQFRGREWRFLTTAFLIGLIAAIPVVMVRSASPPGLWGTLAESAVGWLVVASFLPALPAQALDRQLGLRGAWRLTQGNLPRLFVLMWWPSVVLTAPLWALGEVVEVGGVAWTLVEVPIDAASRLASVVVLSVSYRFLTRARESSGDVERAASG